MRWRWHRGPAGNTGHCGALHHCTLDSTLAGKPPSLGTIQHRLAACPQPAPRKPTCAAPASCIASPKCCFTNSKCSSLRPAPGQSEGEGAGVVTPPGMPHKSRHLQQLPHAQVCRRRGMQCHAAVSCGACFEYQGSRARCTPAAPVLPRNQQHAAQPGQLCSPCLLSWRTPPYNLQ